MSKLCSTGRKHQKLLLFHFDYRPDTHLIEECLRVNILRWCHMLCGYNNAVMNWKGTYPKRQKSLHGYP